jgi:hypothetical protein
MNLKKVLSPQLVCSQLVFLKFILTTLWSSLHLKINRVIDKVRTGCTYIKYPTVARAYPSFFHQGLVECTAARPNDNLRWNFLCAKLVPAAAAAYAHLIYHLYNAGSPTLEQ